MTDDGVIPIDGGEVPDDPALAARIALHYRATPAGTPEMAARCTQYVLRQAARTSPLRAFRRPRHWAIGIAAIAAVLLVTLTIRSGGTHDTVATRNTAPVATLTPVDNGAAMQFDLRLPTGAAKVSVVGDFNGWDTTATPMQKSQGDVEWSAKITLLPGRHVYAYIVNGETWVVDPLAPQVSDADYGPANAVVVEGGIR
jgi:hypothetical protein